MKRDFAKYKILVRTVVGEELEDGESEYAECVECIDERMKTLLAGQQAHVLDGISQV